jgi:hypothetical protein
MESKRILVVIGLTFYLNFSGDSPERLRPPWQEIPRDATDVTQFEAPRLLASTTRIRTCAPDRGELTRCSLLKLAAVQAVTVVPSITFASPSPIMEEAFVPIGGIPLNSTPERAATTYRSRTLSFRVATTLDVPPRPRVPS